MWGRKGSFQLRAHSPPLSKARVGTPGRDLEARTEAERCCLLPFSQWLIHQGPPTKRWHQPRGGTTHRNWVLPHQSSVKKMIHRPILQRYFLNQGSFPSDDSSLCQMDKTNQNKQKRAITRSREDVSLESYHKVSGGDVSLEGLFCPWSLSVSLASCLS